MRYVQTTTIHFFLGPQKEAERHKAQAEASINQRRQQLADLYNTEIEAWRAEAIARVETQEDRKARLVMLLVHA